MRRWLAVLGGALIAAAGLSQTHGPVAPAPATPPVAADAPAATAALTSADVGAWLDGYIPAALKAGKIAGAQVVVVKDGQVLFKKGYGYADVAARILMDVDRHLMRIGSTSKLFTWTAVMQQVEAGRIDLEADINRYLDFRIAPKNGRAITMNDLMRHRGGFEEGLKDLLASDPARFKTTERYLKENLRPQLFPAGDVPAYSNYGTALAGYIVSRVSGEPFDAYVERHILLPLQMRRTTFRQPLSGAYAAAMSRGYRRDDGLAEPFELVTTAPAGSVSTTGSDMAHFMIAHLDGGRFGNGQVLRPETAEQMHRPAVMPRAGLDAMAHGFFWGHRNARLVIGHGGDTVVFHTDLNLFPAERVGIFVSFNSRGENDAVYGARERLFDLFMDRYFPATPPHTPKGIASAAQDAAALAGRYESSRRVESGFISLFYLLQQDAVAAKEDGTVTLASLPGKTFREVAPNLWREVDGTRQLLVTDVGGRRAILDSANPVSILQAAPLARNAGLNLWVAGLSVLVLVVTVVAWPAGWWLRRRYKASAGVAGRPALARRLTRVAALADLLYLAGWYVMLAPVIQGRYDGYNAGLDGAIRALQVAAVVPLAGAAAGLWNLWLTRGRGAWVRAALVALALLGIVWVAWMGGLMSWTLNY